MRHIAPSSSRNRKGLNHQDMVYALVEASVGYHTANGAEQHVEAYLCGQNRCSCERCLSCFKGDLRAAVESDMRHWETIPEEQRKCAKASIGPFEQQKTMQQLAFSLSYPTLLATRDQPRLFISLG